MFIVFNTVAQANNYIKRNIPRHHEYGCGGSCCWNDQYGEIKDGRVLQVNISCYRDVVDVSCHVIGRIKK